MLPAENKAKEINRILADMGRGAAPAQWVRKESDRFAEAHSVVLRNPALYADFREHEEGVLTRYFDDAGLPTKDELEAQARNLRGE